MEYSGIASVPHIKIFWHQELKERGKIHETTVFVLDIKDGRGASCMVES